jgi:hypothetical protein
MGQYRKRYRINKGVKKMIKEAEGYLITTISGRKVWIDAKDYTDHNGYIEYRGDKCYEVVITGNMQKKEIHCRVVKEIESVYMLTWGRIYIHAVESVEKIDEGSFIYEAIDNARRKIKIVQPGNVKPIITGEK